MINQPTEPTEHKQRILAWVLNPGWLMDRFLDQIERLSRLVVPARIDIPSYGEAKGEARLNRLGV